MLLHSWGKPSICPLVSLSVTVGIPSVTGVTVCHCWHSICHWCHCLSLLAFHLSLVSLSVIIDFFIIDDEEQWASYGDVEGLHSEDPGFNVGCVHAYLCMCECTNVCMYMCVCTRVYVCVLYEHVTQLCRWMLTICPWW